MNQETKKIYDAKTDPQFKKPYIDVDEWRTRTLKNGENIPFRYIHGGFEGTRVRFSYCFPEKKSYQGRFFQYLSPFPGPEEEIASLKKIGEDDKIAFAVTHGAYYVESNMGSSTVHGSNQDPSIIYRSCAAVAEYSRVVAKKFYGEHRVYGYVYGGSGGGFKSMSCIENTNAFDGAVPYVIGSPVALPNCLTVRVHGLRQLRNKFPLIADSLEPGGSGDMYEGLNEEEAASLKEVTKMGFPPRAWFEYATMGDGALPVLAPGVVAADPDYFKDFWTVPGYLGADKNSSAVRDRLQFRSVVKQIHIPGKSEDNSKIDGRNGVDDAWQKMLSDGSGDTKPWIELEEVPTGDNLYLNGVNIIFESGGATGKKMLLDSIEENKVIIGACFGMDDVQEVLSTIKPGDYVYLDNSDYIAIQSYHRHQVPEPEFKNWDQYRDEFGNPTIPQRPNFLGKEITFGGAGSVQSGKIQGKVIVVATLMDESAYPWQADWYKKKVEEENGKEASDIFRLWYMDNCKHDDQATTVDELHVTSYMGALRQALLDVSDWVEKGISPPENTNYLVEDGQVIVPDGAIERKGIQPVVTLTVNGSDCVNVKAGEEVEFEAHIEVPPHTGKVTGVEWSFEGEEDFPVKRSFTEIDKDLVMTGSIAKNTHIYRKQGTYFAVVRVKSNRHGDAYDTFTQVKNICRVRIIVE